jgi:hypothetical protein
MRIDEIAQNIYESGRRDQPFVLLLGAGASISSGIPSTADIYESIIKEYAIYIREADKTKAQKIKSIWDAQTGLEEKFREKYLSPAKTNVSEGYFALARLIQGGFFNPIFTLNFDTLLEDSLKGIGFDGFDLFFRGEQSDKKLTDRLEARDGRVKILKLHKPYDKDDFLFIAGDLRKYSLEVEQTLHYFFRKNILVCGCSFSDLCVVNAFVGIENKQDSFYYVNPGGFEGASDNINSIIAERHSVQVAGDDGNFDRFFCTLWDSAFSLSLQNEFPYPIAKSCSVLLDQQSLSERFEALHRVIENTIRFICSVFLADYRRLKDNSSAHSDIRPIVGRIFQDLNLKNAIEFCSQFALTFGAPRYPLFSRPFFRLFADRLQDLKELAEQISTWTEADANEQLYNERHRLVFELLEQLEFLRRCKLTAWLESTEERAELALEGDTLTPRSEVDIDYREAEFRLSFSLEPGVSKGTLKRVISLDPFAILTNVTVEKEGINGSFCFYRGKT